MTAAAPSDPVGQARPSPLESVPPLVSLQLQMLSSTLGLIVKGGLTSAFYIAAVALLWVPWHHALAWALLACAVYGARWLAHRRYQATWGDAVPDETDAGHWLQRLTALSGATGLLWGLAIVWFFPITDWGHQALLLFALTSMATSAAFSQAIYPPAYHAFLIPAGLLYAVMLAWQQTLTHSLMLVGSVLYLGVLEHHMKVLHRSMRETIDLRLQAQANAHQLALAQQQAIQAQSTRSLFLASASHDLRQPAHAMGLLLTALAHQPLNERSRELVAQMQAAVHSTHEQLGAILEHTRLEAGMIEPHRQPLDLGELLRRQAQEALPLVTERGLQLRLHLPEQAHAHSDPALLSVMLRNLIGNACKYTESGGVLIGCRKRGLQWRVDVCDTGIGIDAADQPRVFEPYVRLPSALQRAGFGLGLNIVHNLAQLLNHRLDLWSRPGRGSRFSIWLPMVPSTPTCSAQARPIPESSAPSAKPAQPGEEMAPVPDAGRLVLVIDDDVNVRHAMKAVLEDWGLGVCCAADAASAMELLAETAHAPDLILCDGELSADLKGTQAIELLRDFFNAPELPALIITGHTADNAYTESGLPVLSKPVQPEELLAHIRAQLPGNPPHRM